MENIKVTGDREFEFDYLEKRKFELRTKNKKDNEEWVNALLELQNIFEKIGSEQNNIRSISEATYFSSNVPNSLPSPSAMIEERAKSESKESWKFENLDKDAFNSIIDDIRSTEQTSDPKLYIPPGENSEKEM